MSMVQLFAIILGLIFGSFLNVLIYRLPRNIFFSKLRSFCPHCEYKIPSYSNIPVISYLFQRGRCANCENLISLQYPIVELLSALIWWWASINYGLHQGILFIWICSILVAISIIDYKTFIIPFPLIVSALLGLLVYIFLNTGEWRISAWGGIMGVGYLSLVFLLTSALFNKQTLGFGDLQLIAITGMWLGPVNVLLSVFVSAVLALIMWGFISLFKGFDRNRAMPFGPYLSGSAIILYVLDIDLLSYLSTF
jgi:prepilin signal peptidase PulO-like enzyme (type II secretory pathway)